MKLEKPDDVITILNYCEKNFMTSSWMIDDDYVWPIVRFEFGYMLHWKLENRVFKRNYFNKALKALEGFSKSLFRGIKCKSTKKNYKAIFFSDTSGYSNVNGVWVEKNFDFLIDELYGNHNMESLKIDYNYNNFYPKYKNSLQIRSILDFVVLRSFFTNIVKLDTKLKGFDEFVHFCNDNDFSFSLNSINSLKRKYRIWKNLERYFHIQLSKLENLEFCFVSTYYGFHSSALISACRKYGVKTVDIQHGGQGESHFAYSSWTNLPDQGYNQLPNIFWCWDDIDAFRIRKWTAKLKRSIHEPFVGGNSFLDYFKNSSNPSVKKILDDIRSKLINDRTTILYTANLLEYERANGILVEVIRATKNKCNWLIRVHPQERNRLNEFKDYYNSNGINEVGIDWCAEFPLYSLISACDFHVTLSSSSVLEAESMGKLSILLDNIAMEMYGSQIQSGSCKLMTKVELINFIFLFKSERCSLEKKSTKKDYPIARFLSILSKEDNILNV
jgi:hypothetical protein